MSESLPVLVVEDEELLLSFLKTALERGGVKVVGATSGAEALGLLEQEEFAGVVSDLRMPGGIGGAEIFDWVRQNRPELSARFLFITGNVRRSLRAGSPGAHRRAVYRKAVPDCVADRDDRQ